MSPEFSKTRAQKVFETESGDAYYRDTETGLWKSTSKSEPDGVWVYPGSIDPEVVERLHIPGTEDQFNLGSLLHAILWDEGKYEGFVPRFSVGNYPLGIGNLRPHDISPSEGRIALKVPEHPNWNLFLRSKITRIFIELCMGEESPVE